MRRRTFIDSVDASADVGGFAIVVVTVAVDVGGEVPVEPGI